MKKLSLLLLLPLLFGLACTRATSTAIPVVATLPSMNGEVAILSTPQSTIPKTTNLIEVVCTGIPDGKLHVRECPAEDCTVLDYLREGQQVTVMTSENGWIKLAKPAGWVNGKYLCEAK